MTTPLQFFAGQRLTAAQLNQLTYIFASKGGDTTVTSSTTLINDPDLVVPVTAGFSYYMWANFLFTAAGPNIGDIKYTFGAPAGTTFSGTSLSLIGGTSTVSMGTYQPSGSLITTVHASLGTTGTILPLQWSGLLTITTGGQFNFQWAQNTSNATGTVLKSGSHMYLKRVL